MNNPSPDQLASAEPTPAAHSADQSEYLLEVDNIRVHFPVMEGVLFEKQVAAIKAVDGVSFKVKRGETFGLVGESGCGKSTTALAVLKMQALTSGRIRFEGDDISDLTRKEMRPIRQRMQMVYQDPFGSLNPRMKVRAIIGEPLQVHDVAGTPPQLAERVDELMAVVGLLPDMADRYPHEFSGGQRQRIGIARALALSPSLIICDEPVSALDVSIQAQVVNLFMDLQKQMSLTYLFIAHDLSVVRHISDRIGVMYLGKLVEVADRNSLFDAPKHPYTQALLAAVPVPDPVLEASRPQQLIVGEVPSVRNPPPGCRFHPRCTQALAQCATVEPELSVIRDTATGKETQVACHLY